MTVAYSGETEIDSKCPDHDPCDLEKNRGNFVCFWERRGTLHRSFFFFFFCLCGRSFLRIKSMVIALWNRDLNSRNIRYLDIEM
jgi:hypothetical protein